jgi:hypothetical protein
MDSIMAGPQSPSAPAGLWKTAHKCDCDPDDIDRVRASVFPGFLKDHSRFAAGLCLCEPVEDGFSYTIIGSSPVHFDSTAEGLPRDSLCVCGERVQVNFLSDRNSRNRRYHFLVVPRGIEALVPVDWHPGRRRFYQLQTRLPVDDFLCAVAFESGSGLRFVGDSALFGSARLTWFFVPATVEKIGDSGFGRCRQLAMVTLEPGSRLTSMKRAAFEGCGRLQFINSMLRLSHISPDTCKENSNLRSLLIPGTVIEIGSSAFASCVSLSEVDFVLPSKLTSIRWESFRGCRSLSEFRIVGSVRQICGNFLSCSGVHHVSIDEDNPEFDTVDGFLVNRDKTSIICYFGDDCDVRIGADIETVGDNSFEGCRFLRSVTFESGSKLKRIGRRAFSGCMLLKRVEFGGSCPTLDCHCFACCVNLAELVFPSPSDRVPRSSDAFC